MLVLFTLLSVATSVFTIMALNQHLVSQIDEQLAASIASPRQSGVAALRDGEVGPGTPRLEAQFFPTRQDRGYVESRGSRVVLTPAQLERIESAVSGGEPQTIFVAGTGRFRVRAAQVPFVNATTGEPMGLGTRVVGLSTAPTDATISRMIVIAMTGVFAGVLLVGGIGTWIVRRNLEPLRRVADTATRVSRMPLHTGQVALPERVAAEDTDTRTEVGQVGAAFNEMLDHVDEALNARHRSEQRVRQFVADASHELRTPLASIKGYAELSKRESNPVPESVTHAMGRIESEAGRMGSLVEDLLLLARLDTGRPLDAESVDVSMLVVNAVSDAHAAAPSHEWKLDLPPEPVEVRGDPARLHQVVTNLLANARTHTPAGTSVTTSVRPEGDWVRIAVHDNGPGVPVDLQPNVFERFARGDNARSRAGGSTGLGLSIVEAVTRAHGGHVEMSSGPGDTTFAILLPST
ncbi:sensor histidine kinase [Intrasporangium sp.]|uniref:sensor histidine kinase n=1 Tax=Intrasporangium sp. TaxID=1925024 RepID=UPI0039C898F8